MRWRNEDARGARPQEDGRQIGRRALPGKLAGWLMMAFLFVWLGMPATAWSESRVVAWGSVFPIPDGLTNVVSLATRSSHTLALREDGRISAWGDVNEGVLNVPEDLPPMASVTVGYGKSGGLARSGEVAGWGTYFPYHVNCDVTQRRQMVSLKSDIWALLALRNDGVAGYLGICDVNPEQQTTNHVVSVAANHGRQFAIRADGSVHVFDAIPVMVPPDGLVDVASVSVGDSHVIGLLRDGTLTGWGSNQYGQLDFPTAATNVVQVAASGYHSLALREDGTVVAWGQNGSGQASVPEGLSNVVAVAAHFYGSMALVMEPTAPKIYHPPRGGSIMSQTPFLMRVEAVGTPRLRYQWRKNGTDVPDATNGFFYLPIAQAADSGDYTVAVGNHLGTNESAVAQLIVIDTPPVITQTPTNALHSTYSSPVTFTVGATGSPPLFYQWQFNGEDIPDATNATYTVSSPTFASEGEYRVRVWNAYGEEYTEAVPMTLLDVVALDGGRPLPKSLTNLVDISVNQDQLLALKADGQLVEFGLAGPFPPGVPSPPGIPVGVSNIVAITSGERHYLALRRDGYVYAWGVNNHGQVSGINGLTGIKSIASGFDYNLVLTTNDVVLAAGNNSHGQVSLNGATFPGAVAVTSGNSSRTSYVINGDGSVVAWGQDHHGLLTSAAALQGIVTLSGGIHHAAALSAGGSVIVFGNNTSTTSPVPPSEATNVVHLVCTGPLTTTGFYLTDSSAFLAIRADGTCVTWGDIRPIPEDLRSQSIRSAGLRYRYPILLLDRSATSRRLITARTSDNQLELKLPTTHRRNYLLQARDSLTAGEWREVQTLPGNGRVRFFNPQAIGSGERYFRLELQETFGLSP